MTYDILRAGCASPDLKVADCDFNADKIIETVKEADEKKIRLLVFPELSITGYTCADLFFQTALKQSAKDALEKIACQTKDTSVVFTVGLPFESYGAIYNCAAYVFKGQILAIIPKSYIPNYSEFYERRWFAPASSKMEREVFFSEKFPEIPFGTDILIQDENNPLLTVCTEICEDVWVPLPPSTKAAMSGATVIANLSASNEVVGKADYRRMLVSAHSAKTVTAYIYSDAGHDESTTDMVFSGHNLIALNGTIKAESKLFGDCGKILFCDLDLERLAKDRERTTTFRCCAENNVPDPYDEYRVVCVPFAENDFAPEIRTHEGIGFTAERKDDEKSIEKKLFDFIDPHPFVPSDEKKREERCRAVIEMQAEGLAKRLRHINAKSAVIGLSGGLDSTLALLVTAYAFDKCGIERKNIEAITMPCFGTTDRTYGNACALAEKTGASLREINIKLAVNQHFSDIGQDPENHDVTYENSQARERTQILMDYANKTNGIVIGTGDLSELALGWCTYNGDHMSMYGVNGSIPKTLVRYLVQWFADKASSDGDKDLSLVLNDILDTPVSPELIPPEGKNISQKTEEIVGPYELHDFFLYYALRWAYSPKKIFFLATQAFKGTDYTKEIIMKWLKTFYRRFFSQQFKRSCMPDGAKVGTVSLSPRGDWRMPSDASSRAWLKELEDMENNF
ncbi:MAG: NAD(+) synthase [Treponema sp.]|nr:NAD(+) synthase [Treponema sp.]